jgi:MFS family permease
VEKRIALETTRYRWVVLFSLFYSFVAYAFIFQMVPPLVGSIMQQFGITSSAQAGLLMTIVVIPGILLALPAGLIVDKYGFRLIGSVSTVLAAVGSLVTATANSFPTLLFGRLILGIGGAFIVTATPSVIPQWFSREELGKAMGFYGTNMPLATVTAFPIASMLLLSYDWRFPFYLGTIVAAIASVVFLSFVREGPLKHKERSQSTSTRHALANIELWKASLVWLFFQVTAISFLSWGPKLFEEYKGLDSVNSSLLASVLMLAAIVFVPLNGWVSDRIGRRKPFLVIGSFSMAVALVASGYALGSTLIISVMILGVAAAMVPPVVSTLPAEILESDAVGIGFGVLALCMNIGVALAAPLLGYFVDVTGSLVMSFAGIAAFSVAGAIVAYTLKTK